MEFRIADTFTDSLARLTNEEQKAVKTTAFDLQMNPAAPGLQFHKLDRAKDKNFWSIRVNVDLRLIVHRSAASLLLCYVDHHDKAYAWAEKRRLEAHPKTGAAQLVEIRERVEEIVIATYVEKPAAAQAKPLLFEDLSDDELLGYGVPTDWIVDVRKADEDSILTLADHLPAEAAEALVELATGGKPRVAPPAASSEAPFDHPDAQRRFRVMTDADELGRALDAPWERWIVFLHPEQRDGVERSYSGPARVSGSAGTGKTIVALHRAVHLARANPEARVLLGTFSEPLANALRAKLRRLVGGEPRLAERIEVRSLDDVARRFHAGVIGEVQIASAGQIRDLIRAAADAEPGHEFSLHFLVTEWEHVVDAWQVGSWETYRDVARLGRKTRLPEAQRAILWKIFENVLAGLAERGLTTTAGMYRALEEKIAAGQRAPFDHAVVDESQDLSVSQLRFLAALGGGRPNALFFAGDLGQRIFQIPFSWKSLGVDVRGRSRTLRVNYRTSHQIRAQADRLLGPATTDVDGIRDERRGTISVFNGPPPVVRTHDSEAEETATVAEWLKARTAGGAKPHEIAVFVRSEGEIDRAKSAVDASGLEAEILDDAVDTKPGRVSVSTMHLAKGLEFRAVAVMACDDEILPLQSRIETAGDESDLRDTYETERQLLYVACTRARDHLLVTSGGPASEFLDDLRASGR